MPLFRYGSQPLADYKYQNLACKLQYTNSVHILAGTLISRCQLWNDVTKHRTACNVYTARTALRVDVYGCFTPSSVLPFTYSMFPAYFPAYSVKTQAPSSGCFKYFSAVHAMYAVYAVWYFVTPYWLSCQ